MSPKVLTITVIVGLAAMASGFYALKPSNGATVTSNDSPNDPNVIKYLPLGDSYTIGESVAVSERWPNQLAASYQSGGKRLTILVNPAVTGFTTQNLIDRELPLVTQLQPDFVTVQIGVNDFVRGISASDFEKNLQFIIETLQRELKEPKNVLLVTIPDFAKTPSGRTFGNPTELAAGIENFNAIIKKLAAAAVLPVADVFTASQVVASDPDLVAKDGLHPSGKQYAIWTEIIQQTLMEAELPI